MRGRTLDDSFIILDEAQNTTREQMKMFLTRLGFGSKIVITGDTTQIDLPGRSFRPEGCSAGSGRGEGHCHLPPDRRGRSAPRPGQEIIKAYERHEQGSPKEPEKKGRI